VKRISALLDRYLGRGAYTWIRRFAAPADNIFLTYASYLESMLNRNHRWLDAGCGHQVFNYIDDATESGAVARVQLAVGCDLEHSALRHHRSMRNRVCCDLSHLPFANRSFTLITLNMVAEHLECPRLTFSELARILDDGGLLVILTPNAASYSVLLSRIANTLLPRPLILHLIRFAHGRQEQDVFRTFYRANTRRRLLRLARDAGLREDTFLVLGTRPVFYFLAPLCALELLFISLLRLLRCKQSLSADILAAYQLRLTSPTRTRSGVSDSLSAPSVLTSTERG
jgi:SAM-dependent methyltransferase